MTSYSNVGLTVFSSLETHIQLSHLYVYFNLFMTVTLSQNVPEVAVESSVLDVSSQTVAHVMSGHEMLW